MRFEKQVNKSIYEFDRYMSKERWSSLWHQLNEVQKLNPENVLEIGPGPGLFKRMATALGIHVETLDFDPELMPDHVASATEMPFEDATYDVVCAFQMLEHLPYSYSLKAFSEMVRVSKRHVVISLPDARSVWRYQVHVPKFGVRCFLMPRPQLRLPNNTFDGQHYWEINKFGYTLTRIVNDFTAHAALEKTYRVWEMPYHRFFVFKTP